jgi:hypothetical protein
MLIHFFESKPLSRGAHGIILEYADFLLTHANPFSILGFFYACNTTINSRLDIAFCYS